MIWTPDPTIPMIPARIQWLKRFGPKSDDFNELGSKSNDLNDSGPKCNDFNALDPESNAFNDLGENLMF